MNKNVLKIIIVIALVLIVLFCVNVFRNYSIINEICDSNEEFKNSINNYYYKESFDYEESDLVDSIEEIYFYDGIYARKSYYNDEIQSTVWFDSKTNENVSVDKEAGEQIGQADTNFISKYKNVLLIENEEIDATTSKILSENLFTPITTKDGCYVINYNGFEVYVDTDTNLIKTMINDSTTVTFDIDLNKATSEDVNRENLNV